jgi:hypothetical protein
MAVDETTIRGKWLGAGDQAGIGGKLARGSHPIRQMQIKQTFYDFLFLCCDFKFLILNKHQPRAFLFSSWKRSSDQELYS